MKSGSIFIPFWNTMMSFDWSQYLTLAKELAGEATIPAEGEARLRERSVVPIMLLSSMIIEVNWMNAIAYFFLKCEIVTF